MNPEAPADDSPEPEPTAEKRGSSRFFGKISPIFTELALGIHRGSARLPLKTEVRVGLAAIVSFSILVTVLILNRGHGSSKTKVGETKGPHVAASSGTKESEKPKGKPASPEKKKAIPAVAEVVTPPVPTKITKTPTPPKKPPVSSGMADLPPLPSTADSPESNEDELVDIPPLPESLPRTARTEIAMSIPPRSVTEEAPDVTEDGDILPPPPTTMLEQPKPAQEDLDPPPPTPATEIDLPHPVASVPEETPEPAITEGEPVEQPEVVETPAAPLVEPAPVEQAAPAMLTNIPPVTPAPEIEQPTIQETSEPIAASGNFEPLPLSNTPLTIDNVPSRLPRAAAPAPVDVARVQAPNLKDDAIEPVTHVVQKGENFFTISRLYYGSGRFYEALWAANKDQVSAPDRLFVGTTIKVPPPERLDRSRIKPVGSDQASRPATKKSTAPATREAADVIMMLPRGRSAADSTPVSIPKPEKTYPYHVVKRHETLRSIARDLLDDPHRANDIRELNLDQLDSDTLEIGQRLRLPEDATVRR